MSNLIRIWDVNQNQFWFSYNTVIAFKPTGKPIVITENEWSNTTGKHLNLLDGGGTAAKKDRLPRNSFYEAYEKEFGLNEMPQIERL